MVELRGFDKIQQEYIDALLASGSGLVIDQVEGSLAYTFSRASAVIATQQEYKLKELETAFSPLTATGYNLDAVGSAFLARLPRTRASGYVMAQSDLSVVTLPYGTNLIDLQTGEQYTTLSTPNINILDTSEVQVPVRAVLEGSNANVSAGTQLYAPNFPRVSFVVGLDRYNGVYRGDISGGADAELDEIYRLRLLQYFSQGPTSSEANLLLKLQDYPLVSRAFVRTTSPGFVEIWLDSAQLYTETQLKEVYEYVLPYLSVGVIPVVSQVRRKVVDVEVSVTPFRASYSDLSALSNQIRASVETYFSSLSLGSTLYQSRVISAVRPLVREVILRDPTEDISVGLDEIVSLGVINVVYPLN